MGQRIRQLREAVGMTQRELAEAVGVTPAAVCNWETGFREPGEWSTMRNLAVVLKTSVDYLLS